MLGIHDYLLFVVAGVLLNLTPGQDTMFILGRSLTGGQRAGLAAALGISVGSVVHTLAAALGLSALLAASPLAFTAVKLVGAVYLVYLGAQLAFAGWTAPPDFTVSTPVPARDAFRQGILTNLLNPKVALFFLALLPQFIDPASSTKTLAFLALGATFITTGGLWCCVLALAAARLRTFLLRVPSLRVVLNRAMGVMFIALGARLAWSR